MPPAYPTNIRQMSAPAIIAAIVVAVVAAAGLLAHTIAIRWPLTDRGDDKFTNTLFILVPTSMAASALLASALSGSRRASIWAILIALIAFLINVYVALHDIFWPPHNINITVRIFNWIWVVVSLIILIMTIVIAVIANKVLGAIRSSK